MNEMYDDGNKGNDKEVRKIDYTSKDIMGIAPVLGSVEINSTYLDPGVERLRNAMVCHSESTGR